MSNGFSSASRHLNRRRRWLAQLPEETPPAPILRVRSRIAEAAVEDSSAEVLESSLPVSSILPRRTWVLVLLVAGTLLTWAAMVGLGAWLDFREMDPWRDILGLRSGRLLQFFTTLSLLTCSQLSYLILWRRSRSRKDFAGKYRVWFWVGAVCSVFCVATVTRFHERFAARMTQGLSLVWAETATVCWLVPATTMLLSAMHLMRRDMPFRSPSTYWVQCSRVLAILAGISLLFGSLVMPANWVEPVNVALTALWPAVFASSLLIHARFVTYVTNEASRERRVPSRASRWEARAKIFARHVALLASEEWKLYREKRVTAKASKQARAVETIDPHSPPDSPEPKRLRRPASVSPAAAATAPLKQMQQRVEMEPEVAAKAVNIRSLTRPEVQVPALDVHSAHPIPAPHFPITEVDCTEEMESSDSEIDGSSTGIPEGYSREQWKSLSKKERKRLQRVELGR